MTNRLLDINAINEIIDVDMDEPIRCYRNLAKSCTLHCAALRLDLWPSEVPPRPGFGDYSMMCWDNRIGIIRDVPTVSEEHEEHEPPAPASVPGL